MGFRMGLGWAWDGFSDVFSDGLVMGNGEKKSSGHARLGIRMWFVSFHACRNVQEGQKKRVRRMIPSELRVPVM